MTNVFRMDVRRLVRRAVLAASIVVTAVPLAGAGNQARVFTTGTPSELQLARTIGLEFIGSWAGEQGIRDELRATHVTVDDTSAAHVRIQQFFENVPVFGGEAIVHIRPNGEPFSITDDLIRNVNVDPAPRVTRDRAVDAALREADYPTGGGAAVIADLWVFRRNGVDHLVYRAQLPMPESGRPALPVLFVDAHTGAVVWYYDNLQPGVPR